MNDLEVRHCSLVKSNIA